MGLLFVCKLVFIVVYLGIHMCMRGIRYSIRGLSRAYTDYCGRTASHERAKYVLYLGPELHRERGISVALPSVTSVSC